MDPVGARSFVLGIVTGGNERQIPAPIIRSHIVVMVHMQ